MDKKEIIRDMVVVATSAAAGVCTNDVVFDALNKKIKRTGISAALALTVGAATLVGSELAYFKLSNYLTSKLK